MKIYFSRAGNLPSDCEKEMITSLTGLLGKENITMHMGGAYDATKLIKADLIIVAEHPNHKKTVGKGIYSEIKNALDNIIPAYMICISPEHDPSFSKILVYDIKDTNDWKNNYGIIEVGNWLTEDEFMDILYKMKC